MLRRLVTMAIWGRLPLILWPPAQAGLSGLGVHGGFKFAERGWQESQPASPQAKHLLGPSFGSPLPTSMSLVGAGVGLSRRRLLNFHLRGPPRGREGTHASGPSFVHSCGERGQGGYTVIWDQINTSLRLPAISSLLSVSSPFNHFLWGHGLAHEAGAGVSRQG